MHNELLDQSVCRRAWEIFFNICQVPRPSGAEEKISAFIQEFATKNNLSILTDDCGNLILKKPAQNKSSDKPAIILQAHLDMVPQKEPYSNHDFLKDPIKTKVEDGWIKAEATTLGADNGLGLAVALAILEDKNIIHGPLEALFTVDEERGLSGALGLKNGLLSGKVLINLDSEDEGKFIIGCAGGQDTVAIFDYTKEEARAEQNFYSLNISGLKGGHSGLDIGLGRGNANKILARILYAINQKTDFNLVDINGGELRNAIPREASASIAISCEKENILLQEANSVSHIISDEFKLTDPGLRIEIKPSQEKAEFIINQKDSQRIIKAIIACPNGVIGLSPHFPGIIETSSNLGVVKNNGQAIEIATLQRSLINSKRDELSSAIKAVFDFAGGQTKNSNPYPGWSPNPNSSLLTKMKSIYQQEFSQEPIVEVIHAGLECGIIGSVYPGLDMISCGPTIRSPHSPSEKLEIASVEKFWTFLIKVLEKIG